MLGPASLGLLAGLVAMSSAAHLPVDHQSQSAQRYDALTDIPAPEVPVSASSSRKLLAEEKSEFSVTNLCLTLGCVCMAALAAGLTMGLVSLDEEDVDLVLSQDPAEIEDDKERKELMDDQKAAGKLHFFVHHGHWTMVTLLLLNAGANEALPIFLDKLVPSPVIAILISVTAVLIFGEILPTAIFTGPKQLKIASSLSPVVWAAVVITTPISYPISKLLDKMLGEHAKVYTKSKFRALLRIQERDLTECTKHSQFEHDEITMMKGALDLKSTLVKQVAIGLDEVNMLDIEEVMDIDCMARLYHWGHSRIPVYEKHPHNVRGYLCVKDLIVANPNDKRPLKMLMHDKLLAVHKNTNLQDLLNHLQAACAKMAIVCDQPAVVQRAWDEGTMIPAHVHMLGIVTIYTIFKVLIGEDFADEDDLSRKNVESAGMNIQIRRAFYMLRKYARGDLIRAPSSTRSAKVKMGKSPLLDFKRGSAKKGSDSDGASQPLLAVAGSPQAATAGQNAYESCGNLTDR